jgi:YfiR/HmsC-like
MVSSAPRHAARGRRLSGLSVLWLVALLGCPPRADAEPSEYQVKAVFLYNFSHFIEWPPQALGAGASPFTICVLGSDPFEGQLDDAIRGERIAEHPIAVRRMRDLDVGGDCQVVFIARSESARLNQIVAALDHRNVLTVSELDGAAQRGVMIQFVNENNRVKLRINADAARAAGLVVSSKLLRLAEIVGGGPGV